MAGDVVYADIKMPGGASRTNQRRAATGRSDFECLCWHRRTLLISGGLHIIAVLALIGFGVWVFRLHHEKMSLKCPGECCSNVSAGVSPAPSCSPHSVLSCPLYWEQRGQKCYYFPVSTDEKSWSASHEDCSSRGSSLVVIEDKDELDYLSSKIPNHSWIGLFNIRVGQRWTWVNGSALNENVFNVTGSAKGDYCGATKSRSIDSNPCNNGLYWICQK